MTHCIGIITVPSRLRMAAQLRRASGAQVLSVDTQMLGPWWNAQNVWESLLDEGADWSVILDDDAVVAHGFVAQLSRLLARADELELDMVNLFTCAQYDKDKARKALNEGASWVSRPGQAGVAVALRTEHIEGLLDWAEEEGFEDAAAPDIIVYQYAKRVGLKRALPLPCIVDHNDDIPSETRKLRGKHGLGRTNPFFEPYYTGRWDGHMIDVIGGREAIQPGRRAYAVVQRREDR